MKRNLSRIKTINHSLEVPPSVKLSKVFSATKRKNKKIKSSKMIRSRQ